jgi:hypothetical protein
MYSSAFETYLNKNEAFFHIFKKADHLWSYLGKILILTRHLLNASSTNSHLISILGKNLPEKIKITTTRLKLFSIVGIPFSVVSLKSVSEKISKSYLLNDKEGVVLGSLSFTIIVIDVFDSLTTFVNTTLALSSRPPLARLSALGIPFGFAMAGLGTVFRITQVAKACGIHASLKAVRREMLRDFLEKKLDVTERQTKAAAALVEKNFRAIPGEIELKLQQLYSLITLERKEIFADHEIKEISQLLDDIQDKLKRKFIIEGLGIFANSLIMSALYLFCLGSLSSVPFWFLASSFFIRISSLTYLDLT